MAQRQVQMYNKRLCTQKRSQSEDKFQSGQGEADLQKRSQNANSLHDDMETLPELDTREVKQPRLHRTESVSSIASTSKPAMPKMEDFVMEKSDSAIKPLPVNPLKFKIKRRQKERYDPLNPKMNHDGYDAGASTSRTVSPKLGMRVTLPKAQSTPIDHPCEHDAPYHSLTKFIEDMNERKDAFEKIVEKSVQSFTSEQLREKSFFKEQICRAQSDAAVRQHLPTEIRQISRTGNDAEVLQLKCCIEEMADVVKSRIKKTHMHMLSRPRKERTDISTFPISP